MSILNIKFDLVEVTWDDASSLEHGWVDPADDGEEYYHRLRRLCRRWKANPLTKPSN